MTLKDQSARIVLNLGFFVFVFASHFMSYPVSALADDRDGIDLPVFTDFVKQVQDGDANILRGVYVADVMALPIVQQPKDQSNYISNRNGEVTQFSTASYFGSIGLLAHNNLSGKFFSQLETGMDVRLVFGDGKVERFIVTDILRYQALQPRSLWSDFRNINNDQEILSAFQLFDRVYSGESHVTFQTCILGEGNLNWGRMFVIAKPLP